MSIRNMTISEQIEESFGITEDCLTGSGNHSTGFWRNQIIVDLEELKNSNMTGAFTIIRDVHDTSGSSFREYHGIDFCADLPDGVKVSAIADFCAGLWKRRKSLTRGFVAEWDNGNYKAFWTPNDASYNYLGPAYYWQNAFRDEVRDLDSKEVYDLAYSENIPFVLQALKQNETDLSSEASIAAGLEDVYPDNEDMIFTNVIDAAERIFERIQEDAE